MKSTSEQLTKWQMLADVATEDGHADWHCPRDASFYKAAREAVPALIARVRELENALPKTQDGVTLLPGMTVYPMGTPLISESDEPRDGTVAATVFSVTPEGAWVQWDGRDEVEPWAAGDLYAAPAAG